MKIRVHIIGLIGFMLLCFMFTLNGEEVIGKNSTRLELSGRVQLQHLYNSDTESDAVNTNHGFRMRRGRFQVKASLTDWVSAKFQVELRDNSPRLKDAEAKMKLADQFFVRLGQFKVPVWREELRSSGKLLFQNAPYVIISSPTSSASNQCPQLTLR